MEHTYNGHKNYAYWNVSLWLNNDENLYRQATGAIELYSDKDAATRYLLAVLPERTPDGVKYTFRNVRQVLKHL